MSYEIEDKLMFDSPPNEGVYSQDDVKLYGKVEVTQPYKELVEQNIVLPTRIVLLQSDVALWGEMEDTDDVAIIDEDTGEEVIWSSDGQKAMGVAIIAVRKFLNENIGTLVKKPIAFFNRIVDAERAVSPDHTLSILKDDPHGTVGVSYHSGLSAGARKSVLHNFNTHNGPALMTAVKAIREGINILGADAIIPLRGYGTNMEGISLELQQHHGRGIRPADGKDFCTVVLAIPPIGHADQIRDQILRMVRDLMEETGTLEDFIQVLARGDSITPGTLTDNNIIIHPSTPFAIQEITDAINFTVIEHIKETNKPLANRLGEKDLVAYIDEFDF